MSLATRAVGMSDGFILDWLFVVVVKIDLRLFRCTSICWTFSPGRRRVNRAVLLQILALRIHSAI
jgi:hypothetical protein